MTVVGAGETRKAGRARFAAVDAARGAALVAMIVYHFAWDLWFYGLVAVDIPFDPVWRGFARGIAATFLCLVGIGLVLAHDAGPDARAFVRRLGKIAGAAALVTLATVVAFPESFIFFGVLHMIALGSVLALPFLRLHPALTALVAVAVLAAPSLYADPVFDTRWLAWIGFFETAPDTNDFEPVFPWFAAVLVGVALGRVLLDTRLRHALAGIEARGPLARGLATLGRWSLVVYLAHQPILLGALYPIALLAGPDGTPIVGECRSSCEASGNGADFCARYCDCAIDELEAQNMTPIAARGPQGPEETARLEAVINACVARTLRESPAPD